MLGKLFKYEFKNTSKLMLTIYGVLLAVSVLGALTLSTDAVYYGTAEFSGISGFLTTSMILLYALSVFALFIVTFVYMCIHFYKTMYSDQGYLTHTLPVSPMATFNVKLIVSFVWTFGAVLLMIASILILLTGASRGEIWSSLSSIPIAEMNEALQDLGLSVGGFIGFLVISMVIACLSYLLMVYTCASVGQLFNQYKIVAAIVTGIVIYFVEQIASMIAMFSVIPMMGLENSGAIGLSFTPVIYSSLFLSLGFCIIFYITCSVIVRKHINLS